MKTSGLIPLLGLLISFSPVSAQTEATETLSDLERLTMMGEIIAHHSGVSSMELSVEELEAIASGFTKGLAAGQLSQKTQDNVAQVQMLVQERRELRNERVSKINKAAAQAYVRDLDKEKVKFTESGLGYEVLEPGSDKVAALEDVVEVTYEGKLIDGTVFDSNLDETKPVAFPLGGVIPGFSEGLQLVGEGGKIRLYIPSELAYGENPPGGVIEAGSMLVFEVKLHKIQNELDTPITIPTPKADESEPN